MPRSREADDEGTLDSVRAGASIRALRAERQMTQAELAWAAGVAEGALSSYERGTRDLPLRALLRLAGALGVSPAEIVSEMSEVPEALRPLQAGLDAINGGDVRGLNRVLAPNLIRHDLSGAIATIEGAEGLISYVEAMRRAIPDLRISLTGTFVAGDLGAAKMTYEGTHLRELFGVPPSSARVRMSGIILFRLDGGRFKEIWQLADIVSSLSGAASTPVRNGR